MAVIVTSLRCDLQSAVKVQYLDGNLFSQDVQANRIDVAVFDGEEEAAISGSVTADIVRADGQTVAATGGTIEGNVASITLPAAAYYVPGVISVAVKLTTSGVVTTIACIVANVYRSSTDTVVDPGTIIPSIQGLITQIETAVASIPADYSALWTKLAPAFDSSASYLKNQYVTYNGGLYRFNKNHSGSWVSGDVIPVTSGSELYGLKNAIDSTMVPAEWSPNLSKGYYLAIATGKKTVGTKYACTTALWLGKGSKLAVELSDPDYEFIMSFYDENGDITTPAGYIGYNGIYMSGIAYVPDYAIKFGLSIRRKDQATLSDADITAIQAGLKCYTATDKSLLLPEMPADAKVTGDTLLDMDSADNIYYKGENAVDLNDITADCRIRISDGAETSADTFFSTGFIPVRQGKIVTISHVYDSSTYGSVFYDDQKNKVAGYASTAANKVMTAPAGSAFFRTIFANSDANNASVLITTPILDDIENRLQSVESMADEIEDNMYSSFDINWDIDAGGSFPYGWRTGYWADDGTRSSSTSNIMCVSTIAAFDGARPALHGGVFAKVGLPTGKTNLVVKAFDKTTGDLVKRFDVAPGGVFEILPDCKYGFHMSGSENEITQAFVSAIKVTVFYRAVNDFRPYGEEYEHFTVSVCSKWPDPDDTTTDDNESTNDLSVLAVLTLPNTYTPNGKPTPIIMMCHGYNGYVTEQYWNGNGSDFLALLNAFKDAGFAVFDVDNTRGDTSGFGDWGSLPIMSAYIKAWEYIKKNYNVENRLYLYSYSMGTTVALNMLKWYGNEIVTSLQTACRPICQIRYEALEDTDTRKKEIAIAFGLCSEEDTEAENWTAPAWDTDRLRGFNQYEERLTVGETDIINMKTPPVKVMIGANDTDFQTEAIAYYTALANNGNFVNMRIVSGMNHGAIGYLTNANLREEAVRWFNRFR